MKGIVFTEFLELVEKEFGYEVLDRITSLESLEGKGAYTSVGNYPHGDMLAMVEELSCCVDVPGTELVRTFGKSLVGSFYKMHAAYFDNAGSSMEFLGGIESVIHSDVRKLYPDAKLPTFDATWVDEDTLVLDYSSNRPMAPLAEGAIMGSINHYDNDAVLICEPGPSGDAQSGRYILKRKVR
jgi:hypothetical protein